MKQSPKVIFFGNERLATGVTTTAPTLSALISEGYDVAAVVINNDRAVSRNSRRIEVIDIANQHNIPVLVPDRLMDIKQQLADFQAEIGVLVAYG